MTLEFDGIQFGYDRPLLSSVYMKCEVGKVTGLLGRNGTGKSTLLQIVFGSIRAGSVSVRVDSKFLKSPAYTSGLISYLPQDTLVPRELTLREILRFCRVEEQKITAHFPELESDLTLKAGTLSGGKLRLFEVVLILNMSASFCILDEPFTGLAPVMTERLETPITERKQEKGIIITDHLYWKVLALADYKYLLTNETTYPIEGTDDLVRRVYLLENQ